MTLYLLMDFVALDTRLGWQTHNVKFRTIQRLSLNACL